jgi:hypothetical protein
VRGQIAASKGDLAEAYWREYMDETAAFLTKFGLANKPVTLDTAGN